MMVFKANHLDNVSKEVSVHKNKKREAKDSPDELQH